MGAAYTQRRTLSRSFSRGACFHAKSIITPTKLVTVTPESRQWSIHRLALNFGRITARPPATSAG